MIIIFAIFICIFILNLLIIRLTDVFDIENDIINSILSLVFILSTLIIVVSFTLLSASILVCD